MKKIKYLLVFVILFLGVSWSSHAQWTDIRFVNNTSYKLEIKIKYFDHWADEWKTDFVKLDPQESNSPQFRRIGKQEFYFIAIGRDKIFKKTRKIWSGKNTQISAFHEGNIIYGQEGEGSLGKEIHQIKFD